VVAALLALAASLSWGVGDYAGGLKSRLLPALTVMAASQPFGLVALGIIVAARGSAPPGAEVAWAALSALLGTVGLVAFYRGMAVGAISVVAPIAAASAIIPVAWGVLSGESLTTTQAAGVAAALVGGVAASLERRAEGTQLAAGAGWAVLAMFCFGAYFVPMHAAATHDWLWPAFLFRCTSVTLVWTAVLARRTLPRNLRPHLFTLVAIGLLDTGGNAFFAAASARHGLLSVVSVLGSLYPVVTVLLARVLLGERVQRTQDVGVLVALAGVVLVTAG
jgi:drug/metabolite transporter (DMT)-like permease